MHKTNFDAVLPATRCTADMRERVQAVADASGADKADVIRDSLEVSLVHMELALGLKTLDDFEDEELLVAGLQSAVAERRLKAAMDPLGPGGYSDDGGRAAAKEDRTRGLAWGTPVEPVAPQQ